ncbi:hypothetical protein HAX54_001307 [Datura stramonium]|uniref:Uncharacterized protein n=1 Tax=Datura stramonium TaxID=4076 RepID=A0ABS8RSU2_DATST|nr:hypothetical protein [Datura stramonium]
MLVGDALRLLSTLVPVSSNSYPLNSPLRHVKNLAVGKTKGLGQSLCRNQTTIRSEQSRKGELIREGVCSPRCRFYGQYVSTTRAHASSIAHRMRYTSHGSYSSTSAGTAVRNHAQIAWKKLSCKSFHEGLTFIRLSRFAQALSLALSRSYVILPDVFGPSFRKLWLQVVRSTLERAGPAFIKWGQWAATRPDLFTRDLCTELSKLHTKAPEHSFATRKDN